MGKYWSDCTDLGRFSIQDQLQHAPKFSFKSVDLVVRYPLTLTNFRTDTHDKLKTSFLGVSVLVESRNVLSSTSNFDGIPILPFVVRTWK